VTGIAATATAGRRGGVRLDRRTDVLTAKVRRKAEGRGTATAGQRGVVFRLDLPTGRSVVTADRRAEGSLPAPPIGRSDATAVPRGGVRVKATTGAPKGIAAPASTKLCASPWNSTATAMKSWTVMNCCGL
jgi:hypothetical protein